MKKNIFKTVLTTFMLLVLSVYSAQAQQLATVSVSTPAATPQINVADSFTINASGVTNFGGYQFTFSYNPAVIRIDSVVNSSFLGSGGGSIYSDPATINTTTGTVQFYAIILSGNAPPTTSGPLATINFTPLLNGTSPITLSNVTLSDNLANPIPSTLTNGTITVGSAPTSIPPTSTPVPPTPTLTRTPTPSPSRTPTPLPPTPTSGGPTVTPNPLCLHKAQGDADCNGVVDGIDYSKWLNSQCVPGALQTCASYDADFNGDGRVDDTDLAIWTANRSTSPTVTRVPLPTTNPFPTATPAP